MPKAIILGGLIAGLSMAPLSDALAQASGPKAKNVSGLLSKPQGKEPFPAVVLLHSCGGFRGAVVREWPSYLTGIGYVVYSVNSFGPRGLDRCPNPLQRDPAPVVKDAYAALDYLTSLPYVDKNRVAVMGFSLGANHINQGIIPRRASGGLDFRAAISFYGWCNRIRSYPSGSIPLMQIAAGKDDQQTPTCQLAGKMYPNMEVHVLASAYHAFDEPGLAPPGRKGPIGEHMEYSAAATARARELTRAFLAKHLGKR